MKLDEHGWARTEDLIAGIAKSRPFDMQMLEEIVRTDSKQRYSFNEDKTLIPGKPGAFHSSGCGTGAKDPAGCFMAWNGREVCGINQSDWIDSRNPGCMCICQKIMRLPKQWGTDMESRLYTG